MTMIMLKEKPYIRIVDDNDSSHTTRLKLSEESWERFKEWDRESPDEIPVAADYEVWKCGNCGETIIVSKDREQRDVHNAVHQYSERCCEEMDYQQVENPEGLRLKARSV